MEAQLAAAKENILRRACPFLADQIIDLRPRQVAAECPAQIVEALRPAK
jgi:hypothetical protein